jgi:biotin operon repressor
MAELMTRNTDRPKRDKARMVADDVVTANSLATHLGMTRQNVAQLMRRLKNSMRRSPRHR